MLKLNEYLRVLVTIEWGSSPEEGLKNVVEEFDLRLTDAKMEIKQHEYENKA